MDSFLSFEHNGDPSLGRSTLPIQYSNHRNPPGVIKPDNQPESSGNVVFHHPNICHVQYLQVNLVTYHSYVISDRGADDLPTPSCWPCKSRLNLYSHLPSQRMQICTKTTSPLLWNLHPSCCCIPVIYQRSTMDKWTKALLSVSLRRWYSSNRPSQKISCWNQKAAVANLPITSQSFCLCTTLYIQLEHLDFQ